MTREQLAVVLERTTGHLSPISTQEEKQLNAAREKIASSILLTQTDDAGNDQLFANSDLSSRARINATQLKHISGIADTIAKTKPKEDAVNEQFFLRTTPVLSSQIAGSIPEWAIGAKPSSTYGPFKNSEGRDIWIDFYIIEKLITLYSGNQPILLFKARFRNPRLLIVNAPPIELGTQYELVAGSCWIHAPLLCASAPAEKFTGVEIKGGTIKLSVAPTIINNQLTIALNSNIHLNLQLVQGVDAGAAEISPYGKDARDASYKLPEAWEFTIQNNKSSIQAISTSSAEIFGQAIEFNFTPANNLSTLFENGMVLIPWKPGIDEFAVNKSVSPWALLNGKADLIDSYWVLPAATLNIAAPVQARGNGMVGLRLGKGIAGTWTGLKDEEARLIKPFILAGPGTISIIDPVANVLGATQNFDLWKDDLNKFGSDANLIYKEKAPILFVSTSEKGQEMIVSSADTTIHADRPLKVNGEPFPIHAKTCAILLGANKDKRIILLLAEDLEKQLVPPTAFVAAVIPIKRESIALENGLFTVSPVSSLIFFGECNPAWTKVVRGNCFLSFHLFAYLPTLPDPYVANVARWKALFDRRGGRLKDNTLNLLLICSIRYIPSDDDLDEVQTNFHFGGQAMPSFMEFLDKPEDTTPTPAPQPAPATPVMAKSTTRFGTLKNSQSLNLSRIVSVLKENANSAILTEAIQKQKPALTVNPATDYTKSKEEGYPYNAYEKTGRTTEEMWDDSLKLNNEFFSLLDVSSNANQLGISFGTDITLIRTGDVRKNENENYSVAYNEATATNTFPFIVDGMQVKLPGNKVRAFTLPLMSWEPAINLPMDLDVQPPPTPLYMDPVPGPMYYANDGGATRIWNNNLQLVPLAPIPVIESLIDKFHKQPDNYTLAAITLPFGMKALSYISRHLNESVKPEISNLQPKFRENKDLPNDFKFEGGIQLSLVAGNYDLKGETNPKLKDSPMFPGYTVQFNNVLGLLGQKNFKSNLGHRVTEIFNNEFLVEPLTKSNLLEESRGVPVSRMDITGYGANMFSNWLSPTAAIAQTSQARFDVLMGRTAHEVVQVRSILYPWGIHVVRTITVFRTASGYVFRTDSGWKAESDGLFDFSFRVRNEANVVVEGAVTDPLVPIPYYEFHPGVISGLFNVRNIYDVAELDEFKDKNVINANDRVINGLKGKIEKSATSFVEDVICGPVYFDADVEIENVVQGGIGAANEKNISGKKIKTSRVVSKKILGYVQVAPAGKPLSPDQLAKLINFQNGSIGGDLNCEVNINNSNQQMHLNRVDVSVSVKDGSSVPVFVVAARGQVFLPKDGSWALVQHSATTGEVTQLPKDVAVPLIREGAWEKFKVIPDNAILNSLARVAHPLELLRTPNNNSINFGYLQTTGTQKALFLNPCYGLDTKKLLSKTAPVFADAYRLMSGNSIFPNIGNAIDNFGKAMLMDKVMDGVNAVKAFADSPIPVTGAKALELMDVLANKAGEAVVEQGMKMLQKKANDAIDKALEFAIPQLSEPIYLVNTSALKIYIEYKTDTKQPKKAGDPSVTSTKGKLDFNVDSFANKVDEQWKSRMNNLAMVVDLSDMKRIMTIKGNFDSKKGKESNYEGGPDDNSSGLPTPEIEFGKELQPIVDLLTILDQMNQGDYAGAMKKGLKLAMSNSGEIWEYKFEASKEIATVRFPPTAEAYNSAQTPLKLDASMSVGVYFNAALKVTTDPTQLLPTAGAFLKFHGGLSVMCFSVGVASIYAVGSVDVKLAADTKVGPSVDLAFGFGVSIVVSLPVVGNATVTYMMGIEMHADKTKLVVAILMMFRGQANLLGGLVCVTITIEAKGIMERNWVTNETNCTAQVTFAIDISIFLVIDISFSKTWGETRQIA